MATKNVPAGTALAVTASDDSAATPSYQRALLGELNKLVAPLLPEQDAACAWMWFSGTRDDARACELLQGMGLPGDPGQNKTSWSAPIGGRRVRVFAGGKHRVRICVELTADEAAYVKAERAEADEAKKALKKAAEFDRKAAEAEAALKEQPATEDAFRAEAKDAMWRLWTVFDLMYGRSDRPHASGFRFSAATMETIRSYMHSALWALEDDGMVVFDEALRTKAVREARAAAARHDFPVQLLLKAAAANAAQGAQA